MKQKISVPQQFQEAYENNKNQLNSLRELSQEWKFLKEQEGVSAYTQKIGDYYADAIRIETIFDASLEETAELLFNNPAELLKSKPALKSAEIIEEMNEKGRIILVVIKPMMFINSRDILVYVNLEEIPDGILQVQVGLSEHPDAPVPQNVVRSTTVFGGHFLTRISDSQTKVVYIILNLLNGNIPGAIQKTVAIQHLASYSYYKKIISKNRQEVEEKNDGIFTASQ